MVQMEEEIKLAELIAEGSGGVEQVQQDRTRSRNGTENWSLEPRTGSRGPTSTRRLLRIEQDQGQV